MAGNAIQIDAALTGMVLGSLNVTPSVLTNLTGGGATTSAPVQWNGTNCSGLSYQITKPFQNCTYWHNHLWLWGDDNNPDSLYAADINQPRGFTFMTQNGPYYIGRGDGDPNIQNCVPIGNTMYVLKTSSIYAVGGYDFQQGEYAFSITPIIQGKGIPAPNCVCAGQ